MVHKAMGQSPKRVPVRFYRTPSGTEPVRAWLKAIDPADRKIIGDDLRTLEYGWPMGMPLCRPMASHKGLWEIRSSLPSRREPRILFCVAGGCLVLLHGFIKKAQRTPKADLDLAAKRMKEVLR
jgi:phage-related protein